MELKLQIKINCGLEVSLDYSRLVQSEIWKLNARLAQSGS